MMKVLETGGGLEEKLKLVVYLWFYITRDTEEAHLWSFNRW